jgi:hypothetical protein
LKKHWLDFVLAHNLGTLNWALVCLILAKSFAFNFQSVVWQKSSAMSEAWLSSRSLSFLVWSGMGTIRCFYLIEDYLTTMLLTTNYLKPAQFPGDFHIS